MAVQLDWLEPLHDAAGMRAVDAWAIDERRIPPLRLMEAAGRALAEEARALAPAGPVLVVCGKGNNGGDGLVAARHLMQTGFDVEVLLLWPAAELSGDAAANLERLPGEAREIAPERIADALQGAGLVVDAIFGTGFEGEPRSPADEAIIAINECGAPVVAADIPSGVNASDGSIAGVAVEADLTVSFHAAKLGHRIAPGKRNTGRLRVVDIGIPDDSPGEPAGGEISEAVLDLLPRRGADSTKFTSGSVLVIGGSRGLTGAVALCAGAAVRAGAGYATAAVPASLEPILETKLTEVMTRGLHDEDGAFAADAATPLAELAERADAVVLGPGLGGADGPFDMARRLAAEVRAPLVLDADGLNAHVDSFERLGRRRAATVLTPHPGELGRLLRQPTDRITAERLESARALARDARAIVVLKGDDTLVVDGRDDGAPVAVNAISAPGLATAGTGDVLAGTIGALLARGLDPFDAACASVLACARAGVRAAERIGSAESVIASDVIRALPWGLRG
jgi:ADP-dependent NAD(P)H-hydrate dehydratase / NAD(P)H-hydrate epimerase